MSKSAYNPDYGQAFNHKLGKPAFYAQPDESLADESPDASESSDETGDDENE